MNNDEYRQFFTTEVKKYQRISLVCGIVAWICWILCFLTIAFAILSCVAR